MSMLQKARDWIGERTLRSPTESPKLKGGASFAFVFGWMLVLLLAIEGVTGVVMSFYYSSSTASAWASVAYVEDQLAWGWFIRGLHFHAGSAIVIICGIHLLQTALWGAYKRPRELTWWLGIVSMIVIMGTAVTGFVLRWDQAGYWASRVEVGIAASTPVLGDTIKKFIIGGNDYGNLTLTRFFALHVFVLPGVLVALVLMHVGLARKHGPTPRWNLTDAAKTIAVERWPEQTFRNLLAMTICLAGLAGWTIASHGAGLAAPGDPSSAYDARPLWYFRWLFELRHMFGSWETVAALGVPAVVGGALFALPMLDRAATTAPSHRKLPIGIVTVIMAGIVLLTMISLRTDANDPELAKRMAMDASKATRARALAKTHGVPIAGGNAVFETPVMWRARTLYEANCSSCHNGDKRKAPEITAGYRSRGYLTAFIKAPSDNRFYGLTKIAKREEAMKPIDLPAIEMEAVVEWLMSQTGAEFDAKKAAAGVAVFDAACGDCHSKDPWTAGASAPALGESGSKEHFTHFIGNPGSAIHFGEMNGMPRYDQELSTADRELLAAYLIWLRDATPAQLQGLEPISD
jgi:ubiquinol-cytochrome c reductase cytochrome b subunit